MAMYDGVGIEETVRILEWAYNSTPKQSVYLMGSPGIGKTQAPKIFAQRMREKTKKPFHCVIEDMPSVSSIDARGLIQVVNGRTTYSISPLMPTDEELQDGGVFVADEVPSAEKEVQVALHSLVHPDERRLGRHRLPENWMVVATGNLATDNAGADELLTAFRDRGILVNVVANVEEWTQRYAPTHGIHPLVLGAIAFNRALFNPKYDDKLNMFPATPRGLERLSKVLYAMNVGDKIAPKFAEDKAAMAMLQGCVAPKIISEMLGIWHIGRDMEDPEKAFEPKCHVLPTRAEILYLYSAAVAGRLQNVKEIDKIVNVFEYASWLEEQKANSKLPIREIATILFTATVNRMKTVLGDASKIGQVLGKKYSHTKVAEFSKYLVG